MTETPTKEMQELRPEEVYRPPFAPEHWRLPIKLRRDVRGGENGCPSLRLLDE